MALNAAAARIIAGLFEARTGQRLAPARYWRIETVLGPMVRELGYPSIDALAAALAGSAEAALARTVVEALLNHETSFFRDPAMFQLIDRGVLARIAQARAAERRLRVWCAGCATGQEVYSLAMLFANDVDRWQGWSIDILGSDLSERAVAHARIGRYTQFEIQRGLPITQLVRWFDPDHGLWRAKPALGARVRFMAHNLVDPAPSGAFDVVLCRNVLIYFAGDVRRLVLERIAGAIRIDGALILGAGETLLDGSDHFVSDFECRGAYRPRLDRQRRAAGG